MGKNIIEIYEDEEALLKKLNASLTIKLPDWMKNLEEGDRKAKLLSYFDSSKLGNPTIMADNVAKKWLELNYLFATDFVPKRKPGIGMTGADIRRVNPQNRNAKYLTTSIGLYAFTLKALRDFRPIEPTQEEYFINYERYDLQISNIMSKLEELIIKYPKLEKIKKQLRDLSGYVGFAPTYMPSQKFVDGLKDLGKALKNISEKDKKTRAIAKTTTELSKELERYSSVTQQMVEIRKYHKRIPYISSDGFVRLDSPVASGGLCMVTFPGYDDCYECLPSDSALFFLASQTGSLANLGVAPIIGAGETQGEQYIMHVPRKHFFEEVQKEVNERNTTEIKQVVEIKQNVLEKRIDDIMEDEILGFRTSAKQGDRVIILSPVISEREYTKNKDYLRAHYYSPENLDLHGFLIEMDDRYIPYDDKTKSLMVANVDKLADHGKIK